jgi:tRNA pseudouridine38-40 synthase
MNKPAGDSGGLVRFRVDLAYDGTDFAGWAKQPGLRTVEGDLVKMFEKVFGKSKTDFDMRVAGRTDSGVHAKHQVCHLDIPQKRLSRIGRDPLNAFRLNTLIADDLIILDIHQITSDFDARFSALGRRYRYTIVDPEFKKDPMLVRYALTHKRVLDVDLMNLAAKELIGLKDFAAFCKPRAGASTIRNLTTFQVSRDPGGLITIEIHADAFCHNMIRSLVGSIMTVADGRLSIQDLIQAQKSGKRANKFKTIDAKGLSLESIDYPDPADYAKQANLNRVMREISDNSV